MKNWFTGKGVVITGAASGLGRRMALDLAGVGANVLLLDLNKDRLEETREECNLFGVKAEAFVCDVTDGARLNEIAGLHNIGNIDFVIANAGLGGVNPGTHFDVAIDKKIMTVNYFGMVNTFFAFLPKMIERGSGTLAAISSLASQRGLPNAASYSSSKAAQNNFCESMRLDLKNSGIKVVTICPGFIKTPMTNHDAFDMPFMVPVEKASLCTLRAIGKGKKMYMYPFPMKILSLMNRFMPNFLYDLILPAVNRKSELESAKIFG